MEHKHLEWIVVLVSLAAGLVSALLNVGISRISEKLEPIASGVMSTIPSSIVPASIAIVAMRESVEVVEALFAVPCGILLNSLFLMIWRLTPGYLGKKQFSLSWIIFITVSLSVICWGITCCSLFFALSSLNFQSEQIMGGISTGIMLVFGILMAIIHPMPTAENTSRLATSKLHIILFVLTFLTSSAAVAVSLHNEILGGLLTTFPSNFTIMIISHWVFQGTELVGKETLTLSSSKMYITHLILGSLSISVYSVCFAGAYQLGVFHGVDTSLVILMSIGVAIISLVISVCVVSVPVMVILKIVKSRAEHKLSMIPSVPDENSPLLLDPSPNADHLSQPTSIDNQAQHTGHHHGLQFPPSSPSSSRHVQL